MAGVSNLWVSGGDIAHMSNCAEGRMKFSNGRSSLLRETISVMSPELRSIFKKRKVITSPASPHHRHSDYKSSFVVAPSNVISE